MSRCVMVCMCVCVCRYNIEQEQKLATETTFLVESYTVSVGAAEALQRVFNEDLNA